jgi:hypothetical protein
MSIDWDAVARKVAGVAVQVGRDVVESGVEGAVDAALKNIDKALLEGHRRVKTARGRIPAKGGKKKPAEPKPEKVVVEATLIEDDDK